MKYSLKAIACFIVLELAAYGFMAPASISAPDIDSRRGGVVSDVDPLRSVILLSPSPDERREIYILYGDSPVMSLHYLEGMIRQHKELTDLLGRSGVRTLDFADLLDNALANARQAGKLGGPWPRSSPTNIRG